MINIGSVGYNHSHDSQFVMDRPNGPGSYLFLLIKSSALFIVNDCKYKVAKGSYIIFSPNTPCYYTALEDVYCDDWFYFTMEDEDVTRLKSMGLVLDEPVYLGNVEDISHIILNITYEHYSAETYNEQAKVNYTELLLIKLSRLALCRSKTQRSSVSDVRSSLINLRRMIYDEPDKTMNVSEMAKFVGMSRSSLQHNYKKTFGVSIINDVISGRIERAKRRLSGSSLSIAEISRMCGYKSEYSFMTQFKERTGYTPTEYRNSAAKGESDFQKKEDVVE